MREFLHVDDLADALLFLMENYSGEEHINVGVGQDLSIRELAETIRQVIGYPVIGLAPDRKDLHRYLRDLEEVLIRAVTDLGVRGAGRAEGLTGVWVGDEKLAALGVRVSTGWVTSHGFALNVDPDLGAFDLIVPCGIRGRGVTSLERLLGAAPAMDVVHERLAARFAEVFGRETVT